MLSWGYEMEVFIMNKHKKRRFIAAAAAFTLCFSALFGVFALADETAQAESPAEAPSAQFVTAVPNEAAVAVDNKEPVTLYAYNIDGLNYFKLRDMAALFTGSQKPFNVGYSAEHSVLSIFPDEEYVPSGDEFKAPADFTEKEAQTSLMPIYLDDEPIELEFYNIDGFNYFKLRDITGLLDINTDYDDAARTIVLSSYMSYNDREFNLPTFDLGVYSNTENGAGSSLWRISR